MADDDSPSVGTGLLQHVQLGQADGREDGVRGDGHAGPEPGTCRGPEHTPFDGVDASMSGGELADDARPDAFFSGSRVEVRYEAIGQLRLGQIADPVRPKAVPVDARARDDPDAGRGRRAPQYGQVRMKPDRGLVHDRDTARIPVAGQLVGGG